MYIWTEVQTNKHSSILFPQMIDNKTCTDSKVGLYALNDAHLQNLAHYSDGESMKYIVEKTYKTKHLPRCFSFLFFFFFYE